MENTGIQTNLPLVSVLIPTHERPHYFSLALASVINQTYQNIEIIISDNSCDDETEAIVKSFQAAYRAQPLSFLGSTNQMTQKIS